MHVVVVILSWNKQGAVIACIERAKTLTGARIEIVVVDNASGDDSVRAIRQAHPDVTVLEEPVNRGYAGGVNRGLAEADARKADFAWLVNDDTSFAHDALAPLLEHARSHPDCGLVSPLLVDLDPPAALQFTNGLVDWRRASLGHNFADATFAARVAEGATPIVAGTALLCDMRLFRAIGPFDGRYFAYWEDTDYAVRAARTGFASAVVASSRVAHAAPRTDERPPHYHYYMVRNEALFWRLHGTASGTRRWRRRWLVASLNAIARSRDLGQASNVAAGIDGIWHAGLQRFGPRSDHAPAPRWFRALLGAKPWLLSSLVQGRFGDVLKRATTRA